MTVEMALPRTGIFCILQMTNGPVGDRHLTKALTERQDILTSLVKSCLHAWMVPGARIELATPAFSGRRSTSELPRHG